MIPPDPSDLYKAELEYEEFLKEQAGIDYLQYLEEEDE